MNAAIVLLASQALTVAAPASDGEAHVGARITELATPEILPSATARDLPQDKPLQRHRRASAEDRVTIELE